MPAFLFVKKKNYDEDILILSVMLLNPDWKEITIGKNHRGITFYQKRSTKNWKKKKEKLYK